MKRQEIANRAAERELAEISLEQQVLRELRAKQTQMHEEPHAMSQVSTATSVTDLTVTDGKSVTADWATIMDKSQARITVL